MIYLYLQKFFEAFSLEKLDTYEFSNYMNVF